MHPHTAQAYRARLRAVLAYIDAHLDEDLSVETLGAVAACSKYHFHRQFCALFGIGVYKYVQLCRLKRASFRLAFRSGSQVIDVALAAGYEAPEAFARAFRKSVGQSPSAFRKQPQWEAWHAAFQPLRELRTDHMTPDHQAAQVRIVDVADIRVALLAHRGDPQRIGDTVRRFIAWRRQHRLPPSVSATFNILHDDPQQVAPHEFRLDLCAAVDGDVADNVYGVTGAVIPGGRCAVLRHIGADETLGQTIRYLYAQWLPHSGEALRDFPVYVQRIRFFPDVPEHEAVTDVFLPLR
ncbi:AraC family transcriptional regulator [Noviherbaspirillum autotrophicum]|uniref:AraC family transcriptional regulator n=1 Tax=Noviherbaspirillum autotrophicum TaxID=709839 RepID=A0A0C2BRR5_9BURK|nr:AraC family transcriptional regulator [Noviherbaspirillum autotrophicum]KIF82769.1 AraC family transcriptional regulator [Noviherbaspirillum autotrophicum]